MSPYNCDREENSKKFYELADKLDNLLKRFNDNIYVLNNPTIHLSRNHPEYLNIWKPVIYKKFSEIMDSIKITWILFLSIYRAMLEIIYNLIQRTGVINSKDIKREIDYLFISHDIGTKNNDIDFYYGDIISHLSNSGKYVVRLLIPHSKNTSRSNETIGFKSILLKQKVSFRIVLEYTIHNFIAILQLFRFSIKNSFTYYEILSIIIGQISNFSNYRTSLNIENILSEFKIKRLVMTFEGNAIERAVFQLCHRYNIESLGYQHAPLIKDQNSIFRIIAPELFPHTVLTSGPYTYSIFLKRLEEKRLVKILGSPKFTDEYLNQSKNQNMQDRSILLIPDGNIKSLIRFCKIGQGLSRKDSQLLLKIRAHPLFIDKLTSQIEILNLGNDLCISLNALSQDLANANWVIYENSSVAIQALFYQCNLIYLENELSNVDPLFDLSINKFTARNVNEIDALIRNKSKLNAIDSKLHLDFSKKYFSPLDYSVFS